MIRIGKPFVHIKVLCFPCYPDIKLLNIFPTILACSHSKKSGTDTIYSSSTASSSCNHPRSEADSNHLMRLPYRLLTLASLSQQVDIVVSDDSANYDNSVRCPNILPGVCCKPPVTGVFAYSNITFQHLLAVDIAAVWTFKISYGVVESPTGVTVTDWCSGLVTDSRNGPGQWTWLGQLMPMHPANQEPERSHFRATGASYIRLPTNLPPGPNIIDTLAIQGLLGLAWGGGEWFVSPAAKRLLGGKSNPVPLIIPKDIRSADKGNVFARSPRRVVYPTFMKINGTEYMSNQAGAKDLMYTDHDTGTTQNLTSWFF